jgi:hypothetical protein
MNKGMLPYPVILAITIVGLVLLTIMTYFVGGFTSVLVMGAIVALVYYLLTEFGVLSFKISNGSPEIDFHENAPAPQHETKKHHNPKPLELKEVFFIEGNNYTYNDAPAVCAAYGAELASYDQVNETFAKGGEWCGYGWSLGGMALYPTQQSTWTSMQQEVDETKRTACGRPGVNGGYFDPSLKFGVNCYGVKPVNKGTILPAPLPGVDQKAFDSLVSKFKGMLGNMKLSPFNRNVWSQSGEVRYETDQAKKNAVGIIGTIEKEASNLGADIENAL